MPGIPSRPGAADPQLQELARRAMRYRDQYAQLELGKRYEYGIGVPVNWKAAAQLYMAAGTSHPGGIMGRMGPMGTGIPMNIDAPRKGLPEARARLQALRAKGSPAVMTTTWDIRRRLGR